MRVNATPSSSATIFPNRTATRIAEPGRWQVAFATFGFLIYYGVHFGLNASEEGIASGSDPVSTISQALLLLMGAALVFRYRARCIRVFPGLAPFLLLLCLAMASLLWSQSPEASGRRSLTLMTLLIFALYSAGAIGMVRICRIQVGAMWIAAIASLGMAAVVPASGFDIGGYAGAIRGVFTQKNSLGDAMTCGMIALSFLVLNRRRLVWTDALHACLSLAMTVLAQSTTSLLLSMGVIAATLGALMLARGAAWAGLCLSAGCLASVALLAVFVTSPDTIFNALGKDSTLTGRSAIWAAIDHAVGAPSLLGYGYSAFWLPSSVAVQSIWAELTWTAPSAHSGYLDTLLELGAVGLSLVGAIALMTVALAIWALAVGRWAEASWALIVLGVTALFNYDESSLPRPDIHQLQWVLAFVALSRAVASPVPGLAGLRRLRVVWPVRVPIDGRK